MGRSVNNCCNDPKKFTDAFYTLVRPMPCAQFFHFGHWLSLGTVIVGMIFVAFLEEK